MDNLVSPSRIISIAGKEYRLDGSFATLRAIQESFKRDLVDIYQSLMELRLDEIAKLVAIASGGDQDAIGQGILDDYGQTIRYVILKSEIYAWLGLVLTPQEDREKKRADLENVVEKARSFSLGPTTSVSPSALSDGSPENSGGATSGS